MRKLPPVVVPGPRGQIIAFSVPILLLGLLALGYAGVERSRASFEQNEARSRRLLAALSEAASQVGLDDPQPLQEMIERLDAGNRPLATVWLITEKQVGAFVFQKARTYAVHSDPALQGQRLDSEQARDKLAYDTAKEVELRYEKHAATRPDLTRVVATSPDLRTVSAAGPVVRDGKLIGTVGLTLQAERPHLPLPWLMVLVICLSAIALAALIVRFVPRWQVAGGLALVVLAGAALLLQGVNGRLLDQATAYATARTANDLTGVLLASPAAVQPQPVIEAVRAVAGPGEAVAALAEVPTGVPPAPDALLFAPPSKLLAAGTAIPGIGVTLAPATGEANPYRGALAGRLGWTTAFAMLLFLLGFFGWLQAFGRTVRQHAFAYGYAAPAMIGMAVFVFFPFVSGFLFSFFEYVTGDDLANTVVMFGMHFRYMGLDNFFDILGSREYSLTDARNFYYTLVVTVLWTGANVGLHVSIGLALALVLKNQWVKLKGIYRVLLIVPWAVPNYITALIWRGMFDVEYGTINHVFTALGIGKVAWWSHFWTAFAANLTTNVWLGFPFMMVISLGALQSIPADLYEAAEVDGASRWQQFKSITLPLLKPALFPAVILGTIWTFNMFNIIYLVSGGAPERKTDILITQAYRFAFEGARRYGYAAAYAVIIFAILLLYGTLTNRVTKASEGAFD